MRRAGRELPIVNSEGGYANPGTSLTYRPCPANTIDADKMARWLVRQYVSQWAAGVRQFFFYNFFIDGSPYVSGPKHLHSTGRRKSASSRRTLRQ